MGLVPDSYNGVIITMPRQSGKTTLCIRLFKAELFRNKDVYLVVPYSDYKNQLSMMVELLPYRDEVRKRIVSVDELRGKHPEILFIDDLASFPSNSFLELITYLKTSTFVSFTSDARHDEGYHSINSIKNKLGQNSKEVYYGSLFIGDICFNSFETKGIVLK